MDLLTFIGLTILFYLAYKFGLYLDGKNRQKKEGPGRAGLDSDSESKP